MKPFIAGMLLATSIILGFSCTVEAAASPTSEDVYLGGGVRRIQDKDRHVDCYVYVGHNQGGISCVHWP